MFLVALWWCLVPSSLYTLSVQVGNCWNMKWKNIHYWSWLHARRQFIQQKNFPATVFKPGMHTVYICSESQARFPLCSLSNRPSPWWFCRMGWNEHPNRSISWTEPSISPTSPVCPPGSWSKKKRSATLEHCIWWRGEVMDGSSRCITCEPGIRGKD